MHTSLLSKITLLRRTPLSLTLCGALLVGAADVANAQVGHRPDQSPYQDVKIGQAISLSAGWISYKRDPAGVAPASAPFGQLRYDASIGGPASVFARYTIAKSTRNLLAPSANAPARLTGKPGVAMHIIDGGIDLGLTGKKTWHNIIPVVSGGVGIVSDFAQVDSGGYQFGVKFAISYGTGIRYIMRSGLRLRFDATNYLWQYEYPDRYFVAATDGTAILTNSRQRSSWRGNWALNAGVSIPVFR